jgi:hypothetical protein
MEKHLDYVSILLLKSKEKIPTIHASNLEGRLCGML